MATDYAEIVDAIATMAEGVAEIDEAIEKEADATRLIARSVADAGGTSATIEQGVTTIVRSARPLRARTNSTAWRVTCAAARSRSAKADRIF